MDARWSAECVRVACAVKARAQSQHSRHACHECGWQALDAVVASRCTLLAQPHARHARATSGHARALSANAITIIAAACCS